MRRPTAVERKALRRLADQAGADFHRVTQDGELHFYGRMPGTHVRGWWLADQDWQAALRTT